MGKLIVSFTRLCSVQRGLVSEIIKRFEQKGFLLVAIKLLQPTEEQAKGHYDDLKHLKFFPGLVSYFTSGPIVAMVWQGKDVVKSGRTILGATRPAEAAPGTIRGDLAVDVGRNICHGSDATTSAQREIDFWFKSTEIVDWTSANAKWITE